MSETHAVPLEQANAAAIKDLQTQVQLLTDEIQRITECRQCYGSGAYLQDECDACKGTGKNPAIDQSA